MSARLLPGPSRFFWLFASMLFALACVFIYSYLSPSFLSGSRIASLSSPWHGNVLRTPSAFVSSGSAEPTVLSLPVSLSPGSRYEFTIAAESSSPLRVDFYVPGSDNTAHRVLLEPPFYPTVVRRFHIDSGNLPPSALLRVFYQSSHEVTIAHFAAFKVSPWLGVFRVLLLVLPAAFLLWALGNSVPQNAFLAIAMGSATFAIYLFIATIPATSQTGDNMWYLPTANSLLSRGMLALPREILQVPELSQRWALQDHPDEGWLSIFPIGTPLLVAPFLAVAHLLHLSDWDTAEYLAKFMASVSVGLLFLLLRRFGLRVLAAILVALVFGLASSHFSNHAGGLWSHNTSLLLSLLYLLLLTDNRVPLKLCAAPVAILGYLARPDFALLILAGFAYLYLQRPRLAWQFCILTFLAGVPFIVWSLATFGHVVPPYYHANRIVWSWSNIGVMMGQLLSPNRGLFIYNPFLLLSLAGGLLSFLAPIVNRRLFQILSITCALHAIAISGFDPWYGGYSFGPRLFCPMLGLLFLLVVPALLWLPGQTKVVRRLGATFAVMAAFWGAFVHYRGATSPSVALWNTVPDSVDGNLARIWDWKDMQIFR